MCNKFVILYVSELFITPLYIKSQFININVTFVAPSRDDVNISYDFIPYFQNDLFLNRKDS